MRPFAADPEAEYALALPRSDAAAVVVHAQAYERPLASAGDRYRTPFTAVLQRVIQQIGERMNARVRVYENACRARQAGAHEHVPRRCERRERVYRRANLLGQVARPLRFTRDARQGNPLQGVDQAREAQRLAARDLEKAPLRCRVQILVKQGLDIAADRSQRRAQLVADRRNQGASTGDRVAFPDDQGRTNL